MFTHSFLYCLTLLILLFSCALQILALEPNKAITQYVHRVWQVKDGLPINTVNKIAQDKDGYLWLATYQGIARFDGRRIVIFEQKNVPALKTNLIHVNTTASDGSVWFGTEGGGAVRLRGGVYETLTTENGLAGDDVKAIYEARDGSLWFGTVKKGLSRYKDGTFTNYINDELAGVSVWNFAETPDGSLWIGTDRLPLRLQNEQFRVYGKTDGLTLQSSAAMKVDKQGKLWIGGNGGLNVWQNETFSDYSKAVGFDGSTVMTIFEDSDESLWIGTADKGIIRYRNGQTEKFQSSDGLSSDIITHIYEDREGTLWVATESGGLHQIFNGNVTAISTQQGLANDSLGGLIETDEGMWITHNKGLSRIFEGEITNLSVGKELPEQTGWVLGVPANSGFWITTAGQDLLRYFNGKFQKFSSKEGIPNYNAASIIEDSRNYLWMGTAGGLFRWRGEEKKLFTKQDGLSDNSVQAVLESKNGLIWVGTINGLQSFDGEKFTTYTLANGLPDNKIRTLHEDESGTLWIATNGGLARMSSDNRIASFTVQNGLQNNSLHALLSDKHGNLWMSSNTGISRVSKNDLERFARGEIDKFETVVYGVGDGMKTREANGGLGISPAGWQSRDGKLWFSSEGGAVVIDPNNLVKNSIAPEVLIEEILFNEKLQPISEKLSVNAGTNRLDFRFTAPSFRAPEKVKIQYQLVGYDKEWHIAPSGERQISYTNLPPGDYFFRLKAANEDGVWNETGASLSLFVAPLFYQTWWFYTLCALGFVGTGFLIYSLRLRQIKQRFTLVLEERTRIAREIHDTLAQNFLATSLQLEAAEQTLNGDGNPALKKHLDQARTLAREGLKEARNSISSLRHQKNFEEKSLVADLEKFAHQAVADKQINLKFKVNGKVRKYSELVEHNLFRIGQEAINNALKHAEAKTIAVELNFNPQNVQLRVADDGRGFDKQIAPEKSVTNGSGGSYGLVGLKERAKIIGAQFEVASEKGKGTTVTAVIKNSNAGK
jgi:signal transduction histidine kinase/ligand-binding sensor domain-containing protein